MMAMSGFIPQKRTSIDKFVPAWANSGHPRRVRQTPTFGLSGLGAVEHCPRLLSDWFPETGLWSPSIGRGATLPSNVRLITGLYRRFEDMGLLPPAVLCSKAS